MNTQILELYFNDGTSAGQKLLRDEGWYISLQSVPLGDHECYVATNHKLKQAYTISAKAVFFVLAQELTDDQ